MTIGKQHFLRSNVDKSWNCGEKEGKSLGEGDLKININIF